MIYWERQGVEHTCGIHTLNCLLQRPQYDKVSFAKEAKLLLEEQKQLSSDLDEVKFIQNIYNEEGCSIELLNRCLSKFNITGEYMNLKETYDLL